MELGKPYDPRRIISLALKDKTMSQQGGIKVTEVGLKLAAIESDKRQDQYIQNRL